MRGGFIIQLYALIITVGVFSTSLWAQVIDIPPKKKALLECIKKQVEQFKLLETQFEASAAEAQKKYEAVQARMKDRTYVRNGISIIASCLFEKPNPYDPESCYYACGKSDSYLLRMSNFLDLAHSAHDLYFASSLSLHMIRQQMMMDLQSEQVRQTIKKHQESCAHHKNSINKEINTRCEEVSKLAEENDADISKAIDIIVDGFEELQQEAAKYGISISFSDCRDDQDLIRG